MWILDVSRTNYGLPNLAKIIVVVRAIASLVKWKAPKPISSKYAALPKNLGFINTDCALELNMLNAVTIFYL